MQTITLAVPGSPALPSSRDPGAPHRYIITFALSQLEKEPAMGYERASLGRMAVFLIPSLKLKTRLRDGATVEDRIHDFLMRHFSGFTASTGTMFGYWHDESGMEFYGEHREFKVSFPGKEHIPVLEEFLAGIAREIGERCIYLETGEDAWLIYPKPDPPCD